MNETVQTVYLNAKIVKLTRILKNEAIDVLPHGH